MGNLNVMMIFDVIIFGLGAYLLFSGIKSSKEKSVDPMIIPAVEMIKCSDVEGLSKYLMPKTALFGGICVLLGTQGFLNDMGFVTFSKLVNTICLLAFLGVWVWFSNEIRKAKKKYIR